MSATIDRIEIIDGFGVYEMQEQLFGFAETMDALPPCRLECAHPRTSDTWFYVMIRVWTISRLDRSGRRFAFRATIDKRQLDTYPVLYAVCLATTDIGDPTDDMDDATTYWLEGEYHVSRGAGFLKQPQDKPELRIEHKVR